MITVLVNKFPTLIRFKPLPFGMIKDGFIFPRFSTYEQCMLELINVSTHFKKRFRFSHFIKIANQSNGECDAEEMSLFDCCDNEKQSVYQIDFKLLVSSEIMNNRKKSASEIDYKNLDKGYIAVKNTGNTSLNSEDFILENIRNAKENEIAHIGDRKKLDNSLIKDVIRNLGKNKNLLYFYPYEIISANSAAFLVYLNLCFEKCLNFRKTVCDKDFYLVYYQNKALHLCLYNGNKIILIESIPELILENFRNYKALTDF